MPVTSTDAEVVRLFFQAFIAGDEEELRNALAPDAAWTVPGSQRFPDAHEGQDAVVAYIGSLHETADGSLRPWSEDSWDIAVGDKHVVLLDRLVAQRGERSLDSDEVWVMEMRGGRIWRITQYVGDPRSFDEFWA